MAKKKPARKSKHPIVAAGKAALERMRERAKSKRTGVGKMTLAEINEEIDAVRCEKRSRLPRARTASKIQDAEAKDALVALEELNEQAEASGASKMKLREINELVEKTRRESRARRAKRA